jgi:GNAT superfamily N-acetyltransferase
MKVIPELMIENRYLPGSIGRITEMHSAYYSRHWGFGLYFESKVAVELSEFLGRFDDNRDGIWLAILNDRVEGSLIIDGLHAEDRGAHLRWFIVAEALQGRGIGRLLINRAMHFCRQRCYKKIYLWSFEGLHAARRLYEDMGFRHAREQRGVQWGTEVKEQYYELVR